VLDVGKILSNCPHFYQHLWVAEQALMPPVLQAVLSSAFGG